VRYEALAKSDKITFLKLLTDVAILRNVLINKG
jgi:hypothetical protein